MKHAWRGSKFLSLAALSALLFGTWTIAARSQNPYPDQNPYPVRRPGYPPNGPGSTTTTGRGAPGAASGNASQGTARGFVPPGIDLVAGVRLDKAADLSASLNDIRAVAYDAKTQRLYLIGQRDRRLPDLRLDDLAVALKAPEDSFLGVSIEAPIKDGQMTAHYYGGTEDTHFGQVMFEADRTLKSLAMGRDNVTKAVMRPGVRGYESELRLLQSMGGARRPKAWHRYWFRPELISMTESADGKAARFDATKIEVKTEYVPPVPESESEPAAEAFAQQFTDHFDDYAAEYPIFAELREMAKVAALAQWIKESGVQIDSLNLETADIPKVETPKTTPVGYSQAFTLLPGQLWKHQMAGGVTFRLQRDSPDGAAGGNWSVSRSAGAATSLLKSVLRNPSAETKKWFGAYRPAASPNASASAQSSR